MDRATTNTADRKNVLKQVNNEYDGLMLWCNYCRRTTRHKADKKDYASCLVCHERRRFYWRRKSSKSQQRRIYRVRIQ